MATEARHSLFYLSFVATEFFSLAGLSVEGEQSFQLAADQSSHQLSTQTIDPVDPQSRQRTLSKLWALVTAARYRQGKSDTVATSAQQAEKLGIASGSRDAQLFAYYAWAVTLTIQGSFAEAHVLFANIQTILEQARDRGEARALLADFWWRYYLGLFSHALLQGQYAEAQTYGAAGLHRAQQLGALRGQMILRLNLTDMYLELEGLCTCAPGSRIDATACPANGLPLGGMRGLKNAGPRA